MVLSVLPTVGLPSQGPAPPKYIRGFFFGLTARVASGAGLHGLPLRNTSRTAHTVRELPGLSSRDRGTLGPSGESNAQPIESMPPGALGGCFVFDDLLSLWG